MLSTDTWRYSGHFPTISPAMKRGQCCRGSLETRESARSRASRSGSATAQVRGMANPEGMPPPIPECTPANRPALRNRPWRPRAPHARGPGGGGGPRSLDGPQQGVPHPDRRAVDHGPVRVHDRRDGARALLRPHGHPCGLPPATRQRPSGSLFPCISYYDINVAGGMTGDRPQVGSVPGDAERRTRVAGVPGRCRR